MSTTSERTERTVTFGVTALFIAAILLILLLPSCKHEGPEGPLMVDTGGGGPGPNPEPEPEPEPCDPNTVWFQQQILPLLTSNCAVPGCHDQATDDNDEIQITSYSTLMQSGIVQDGDLWEAINDDDPDDRMPRPPQNPLTPDQIALIGQWIQQGAQNNSCEGGCNLDNITYAGTIMPIIQNRCLGCHSGGTPQGGLNFSSWPTLNMVAQDGRLAGAIQHQSGFTAMPLSGPMLSQCRIDQFLLWIDAGAPNN